MRPAGPRSKTPHSHVSLTVTFCCEGEAYPGGSGMPHSCVEIKHSTWFDSNDSCHISHVQRPRTYAVVDPRPTAGQPESTSRIWLAPTTHSGCSQPSARTAKIRSALADTD
jgi:hypothetical protein